MFKKLAQIHSGDMFREGIFNIFNLTWPWKWGQGHQNLLSFFLFFSTSQFYICASLVKENPFQEISGRLGNFHYFLPPVTLKKRSWSPKYNKFFRITLRYLCTRLVQIHAKWEILHAFLSTADFFKTSVFKKYLWGITSECQTDWT